MMKKAFLSLFGVTIFVIAAAFAAAFLLKHGTIDVPMGRIPAGVALSLAALRCCLWAAGWWKWTAVGRYLFSEEKCGSPERAAALLNAWARPACRNRIVGMFFLIESFIFIGIIVR